MALCIRGYTGTWEFREIEARPNPRVKINPKFTFPQGEGNLKLVIFFFNRADFTHHTQPEALWAGWLKQGENTQPGLLSPLAAFPPHQPRESS